MQFSREAFVCNGYVLTAVLTVCVNGHRAGKMQGTLFEWDTFKSFDVLLFAGNEKWQQEECQPFGDIVGHAKACRHQGQHPVPWEHRRLLPEDSYRQQKSYG